MKWRIMTPEEVAEREAAVPPEIREAEERRAAFDEKHPRCETCGQFLKKRVVIENPLALRLGNEKQDEWISHYVQDYWGEWDHI